MGDDRLGVIGEVRLGSIVNVRLEQIGDVGLGQLMRIRWKTFVGMGPVVRLDRVLVRYEADGRG